MASVLVMGHHLLQHGISGALVFRGIIKTVNIRKKVMPFFQELFMLMVL